MTKSKPTQDARVNHGRLSGRTAIVTGGARGIGAETARLFAQEGASVLIADVLEPEAHALAAQLGPNASAIRADVSSGEDWRLIVEAGRRLGQVTILVNNAAVLDVATIERADAASFERLFRVNQLGPFLGIKAVRNDMIDAGNGSIINVGSVDGLTAQDIGLCAYGATKWALRGLTKMAALELGRFGIRVNCVHPDGGNPKMSEPFLPAGLSPDQAMEAHVHQILEPPRGKPRNNRMQDVANMILFLASDEGAGCTGADFPVDGGYSAGRRFS